MDSYPKLNILSASVSEERHLTLIETTRTTVAKVVKWVLTKIDMIIKMIRTEKRSPDVYEQLTSD